MDDLAICKRIADICSHYVSDGDIVISDTTYPYENYRYPLYDDDLWVNLIIEHEVSISFAFCKLLINKNGVHEKNFTDTESLKRNALLLIIEANNE